VRWLRRMRFEHRRLPKRVRNLRVTELCSFVALVCWLLISLSLRLPRSVINMVLVVPLLILLSCVFAVGVLTWRNYERTAEIRAENVRGRGLESAGVGWLVDTGTMRGLGAGVAIFAAIMIGGFFVQIVWPFLVSRL
jgi:hypothetical protein